MWKNVRVAKLTLWVIFIASTAFLVLFFGLGRILASDMDEPVTVSLPLTPPVISVSQADGNLVAAVSAGGATDWQSVGPNSTSFCASSLFTAGAGVSFGNKIPLKEVDYGRYHCFRILVDGEYRYHAYRVLHDGRIISIIKDKAASGEILLQAAYIAGIKGAWHHISASDSACSADNFVGGELIEGALATVSPASELDVYYCFRLTFNNGEQIYKSRSLNAALIEITWAVDGRRLAAVINGTPAGARGENAVRPAGDAVCSLEDFSDSQAVSGGAINLSEAAAVYCFRFKDSNNYHYARYVFNGV